MQSGPFLVDKTPGASPGKNKVQSLFEDQQGVMWLGARDGGLYRFNPRSNDLKLFSFSKFQKNYFTHAGVWDIAETSANQLWVATTFGLHLLEKSSDTLSHFIPEPDNFTSRSNKIRQIYVDENHSLFLGTQDGVLLFDTKNHTFTPLKASDNLSVGVIDYLYRHQAGSPFLVFSFLLHSKPLLSNRI